MCTVYSSCTRRMRNVGKLKSYQKYVLSSVRTVMARGCAQSSNEASGSSSTVTSSYPLKSSEISQKFSRDFPGKGRDGKPAVLPVIHVHAPTIDLKTNTLVTNGSQTFDLIDSNIKLIGKHKFDGIFLINHGFGSSKLELVIKHVRSKYPKLWIGANFLGTIDPISHLVNCQKELNGLWIDDGLIIVKQNRSRHSSLRYPSGDASRDASGDETTKGNGSNKSNDEKCNDEKTNDNDNKKAKDNINNNESKNEDLTKYFSDDGAKQRAYELYVENKFNGLYFGGVDFKYISNSQITKYSSMTDDEYFSKCKNLGIFSSQGYMDVICTSGKGTGQSADPLKMTAYAQGTKKRARLAVASGVTPENVKNYLGKVDAILIASGIEDEFGILDDSKMAQLKQAIDSYVNST